MAEKRMHFGDGAPVHLKLRAGYAMLTIRTTEKTDGASIAVRGAQDLLDKITEKSTGRTWEIGIPSEGGSGGIQVNTFSGGRVTTTVRGSGTVITGSSVNIGGIRFGRVASPGRVVIDGVDVTDYVREQHGKSPAGDTEVSVIITLPGNSIAELDVEDGDVAITGVLEARVKTYNAPVTVTGLLKPGMIETHNTDIRVSAGNDVTLTTHNGNITLDDARGPAMVTTHNGNVSVHVTADTSVMATSHNGNVDVTKRSGCNPRVMATSHNGNVRKP